MPAIPVVQAAIPGAKFLSEPDRSWTYESIAERSTSIRDLYASKGISLNSASVLAKLLKQAETLARDWKDNRKGRGIEQLIHAAHANRIADAIDIVKADPAATEALRRIARNDVDPMSRGSSQGKDALWELELFSQLTRQGILTRLAEPPDVVAEMPWGEYGVACKKIYSMRGVEAQVRKGCAQLAAFGNAGIVALNIDNLTPGGSLLRSRSNSEAADFLAKANSDFIDQHQRHLSRFVREGRCDGILVSTTTVSDIESSRVRFNSYSQTTLWTLEGARIESRTRLQALSEKLSVNQLSKPISLI